MTTEKRLIEANRLKKVLEETLEVTYTLKNSKTAGVMAGTIIALGILVDEIPTVDAVELPCRCCDCFYLLNGKNSLGLYFFCGHQNGLKNLRNTEKDFCPYAKRRGDGNG